MQESFLHYIWQFQYFDKRGLAISSGIVNDFGGRLTARNAPDGGAVFEVQLPILTQKSHAAE